MQKENHKCLFVFNSDALKEFVNSLDSSQFNFEGENNYKGSHEEQGVIIIANETTIMPSYIVDGSDEGKEKQVFVYNKKWHEMIILKLSEKLATEFNVDQKLLHDSFLKLIDLSKTGPGNKSRIMATTTRLALDNGLSITVVE